MHAPADALYARYSSHNQDDGTSIDVQIEHCERAAGGPCLRYIDRARTGRATAGRSELLRLMRDAQAGKIGRVLVYRFDRLGRAAETHVIARDLEESGVQLISATEGTNTLARGIQLVVAEDYSRQLAQRTRDGLIKRFQQASWTGGLAPYGYRIIERDGRRVLAIDPQEANVVRRLVERYLAGTYGFKELARMLQAEGVPPRAPPWRNARGIWAFTSVKAILSNPMLAGQVKYNRRVMRLDRKSGRRVPRAKPEAEHVVRRDETLRIIDDETYARLQHLLGSRARSAGRPQGPRGIRPFTGHVYCGACGSVCYSRESRNGKGAYRYYACGLRQRHGVDACCNSVSVREDMLMSAVMQSVASIFEQADRIVARAVEAAQLALNDSRTEAVSIRRQLGDLDADARDLVRLLRDPQIESGAKAAVSRQLAETEVRRQALQAALDRLVEGAEQNTEKLAAAVRRAFEAARRDFTTLAAPAELNRFVGQFIGPMVLHADGIIRPRETTTPVDESTGVATGNIAGGGFEPPTSGL